jgi:hypothetical protein
MFRHHVSCSPSKIPYIGFSEVRLQTDIQPRPSLRGAQVKHEACMHHTPNNLYAAKAVDSNSCSLFGMFSGAISQAASQSRGPWLANGLCCPVRSSLTTPSSAPPRRLLLTYLLRPSGLCPTTSLGLASTGSPI